MQLENLPEPTKNVHSSNDKLEGRLDTNQDAFTNLQAAYKAMEDKHLWANQELDRLKERIEKKEVENRELQQKLDMASQRMNQVQNLLQAGMLLLDDEEDLELVDQDASLSDLDEDFGPQEPIDFEEQRRRVERVHEDWMQNEEDAFFFLEEEVVDVDVDVDVGEAGPGPNEEDESRIHINYKGAGTCIGKNATVYNRWKDFFEDQETSFDEPNAFNIVPEDGEGPPGSNPFAPFATEMDWRVAKWVVEDGIGHQSFDRLLQIPGLWEKLGLSFDNIRQLHQKIDNVIPERAGAWKAEDLFFNDQPDVPYTIRYRCPLEAVKSLWGDPSLAKYLVYRPQKVFSNENRKTRIYTEMWTGDWWHSIQKKLPAGATIAPIIIATDKTQLTQFSGGKSAYPVYLTLGNIPKSIRRKPSKRACILLGYLPCAAMLKASNNTKKNICIRNQRLFHEAMCLMLEPLIKAGKEGVDMTGGNGEIQQVYPILACYVANFPEQCLVSCTKYGTCPKCRTPAKDLQNPNPAEPRTAEWTLGIIEEGRRNGKGANGAYKYCMERDVSGSVHRPFWEGFPHFDIHKSITPDILHQLYQGLFLRYLDLNVKIWHAFSLAVLEETFVTNIRKYSRPFSTSFILHNIDVMMMVGNGKQHLVEGLLRKDMNIPKLHSFLHYEESIRLFGTTDNYNTEMFERFHIDFAKEGFRASNKRDVFPQMVMWLSHREKVSMFDSYLEAQDCLTKPSPKRKRKVTERTAYGIAEHSPFPSQPISLIETKHNAPRFSQHLKEYLNKLRPHPSTNRIAHLYDLPFYQVDVFTQFKFHPHLLHDDVANPDEEENDTVKAHPCSQKNPSGRFDTVVALHTDEAQSVGIEVLHPPNLFVMTSVASGFGYAYYPTYRTNDATSTVTEPRPTAIATPHRSSIPATISRSTPPAPTPKSICKCCSTENYLQERPSSELNKDGASISSDNLATPATPITPKLKDDNTQNAGSVAGTTLEPEDTSTEDSNINPLVKRIKKFLNEPDFENPLRIDCSKADFEAIEQEAESGVLMNTNFNRLRIQYFDERMILEWPTIPHEIASVLTHFATSRGELARDYVTPIGSPTIRLFLGKETKIPDLCFYDNTGQRAERNTKDFTQADYYPCTMVEVAVTQTDAAVNHAAAKSLIGSSGNVQCVIVFKVRIAGTTPDKELKRLTMELWIMQTKLVYEDMCEIKDKPYLKNQVLQDDFTPSDGTGNDAGLIFYGFEDDMDANSTADAKVLRKHTVTRFTHKISGDTLWDYQFYPYCEQHTMKEVPIRALWFVRSFHPNGQLNSRSTIMTIKTQEIVEAVQKLITTDNMQSHSAD
ncbi:hypothetical protein NLJ89_g9614 [Agrocybe chaxingu]|uniref:DUF6830 domain-containing protein n=1 Tax=Agrocybe chaxingu TaxID=84603 RepID=A0A9W8JSP9_9AGAR|nr:hypothetical protein NLJ89_g9614 [Agrocybe chaxingu]